MMLGVGNNEMNIVGSSDDGRSDAIRSAQQGICEERDSQQGSPGKKNNNKNKGVQVKKNNNKKIRESR